MQDQTGLPISALKLFHVEDNQYEVKYYFPVQEVEYIRDQTKPFNVTTAVSLVAVSEEEFQLERIRWDQQRRAWAARHAEQQRARQPYWYGEEDVYKAEYGHY